MKSNNRNQNSKRKFGNPQYLINKFRSEKKDQATKKARCKKQDVKNEIREFKPGYKNSMMIKIRCKKFKHQIVLIVLKRLHQFFLISLLECGNLFLILFVYL